MSPYSPRAKFAFAAWIRADVRRVAAVAILSTMLPSAPLHAQLRLTWTDNSIDELGFKIERSTSGGTFTQIATVAPNVVTYVDPQALATTEYKYRVRAYHTLGDSVSSNVVSNMPVPPAFAAHPSGPATVNAGTSTSLTVSPTGNPAPDLQWQISANGGNTWTNVANFPPYSGANTATLSIATATPAMNGYSYRVIAANSSASTTSNPLVLTVAWTARLSNLSVRTVAGTDDRTLIVGFVVSPGPGKPLLVRGIGPTLEMFGVPGALVDPVLSLNTGANVIGSNDDWGSGPNVTQITAMARTVGAFPLPADSRDAALLPTVSGGANTVQLSGKGGAAGVALVELYDGDLNTATRLVNVSARTVVGIGSDALVIGFVITGNGPQRVLVRAVGPTLSEFGVAEVLNDPRLQLFRQGIAAAIDQNNDWGGTAALSADFRATGAFGLPAGSRDAALAVTLEPGAYTAQISGVNDTTGTALVEVYQIP